MVVIAVSGSPGSGKTTFSKAISEMFGLDYWSSGEAFKRIAEKLGMDLIEFHDYAEKHLEVDKEVDAMAVERAKMGNVVIDGHLSGWVLKDIADLKIYFHAPLEVRAKRVAKRDNVPYEVALKNVVKREESNKKRFMEAYGIDISDISIFDLVINTEKWSREEIMEILKKAIEPIVRRRGR